MVQRVTVNDRTLWLKEYGSGSGRVRLAGTGPWCSRRTTLWKCPYSALVAAGAISCDDAV